jgi:hypothetical protein
MTVIVIVVVVAAAAVVVSRVVLEPSTATDAPTTVSGSRPGGSETTDAGSPARTAAGTVATPAATYAAAMRVGSNKAAVAASGPQADGGQGGTSEGTAGDNAAGGNGIAGTAAAAVLGGAERAAPTAKAWSEGAPASEVVFAAETPSSAAIAAAAVAVGLAQPAGEPPALVVAGAVAADDAAPAPGLAEMSVFCSGGASARA